MYYLLPKVEQCFDQWTFRLHIPSHMDGLGHRGQEIKKSIPIFLHFYFSYNKILVSHYTTALFSLCSFDMHCTNNCVSIKSTKIQLLCIMNFFLKTLPPFKLVCPHCTTYLIDQASSIIFFKETQKSGQEVIWKFFNTPNQMLDLKS